MPIDDASKPEVRRCRACGRAAAVCVRHYRQSLFFQLLNTSRVRAEDCVCQACGTGFHVTPHVPYWAMLVFLGVPQLLLGSIAGSGSVVSWLCEGNPSAILGLVCASLSTAVGAGVSVLALRPIAILRASPVVENAPMPDVRFERMEP